VDGNEGEAQATTRYGLRNGHSRLRIYDQIRNFPTSSLCCSLQEFPRHRHDIVWKTYHSAKDYRVLGPCLRPPTRRRRLAGRAGGCHHPRR